MPRGSILAAALAALAFAVSLGWGRSAEATWSGYGGSFSSPADACDSYVGFYVNGGLPNAVLRSMKPYAADLAGEQLKVQCRIARETESDYIWDIFTWTTASCTGGEKESFGEADGCISNDASPKALGPQECNGKVSGGGGGRAARAPDSPACTDNGQNLVGNPVNPGTGNKVEVVTDFTTGGANALSFTRTYNSLMSAQDSSLGHGWRHDFDIRLVRPVSNPATVYIVDYYSKRVRYNRTGGSSTYTYNGGETDVKGKLTRTSTSSPWTYTDENDTKYVFTANGSELTSITYRNGYAITTTYTDGDLTEVEDSYGRTLTFTYGADGQLATMTDPSGRVYAYTYDEPVGWEGAMEQAARLASVSYPDDTPGSSADNPTVTYLYEDEDFPFALTGIEDENGDRFATFAYNDDLQATLSEHAGDAGETTLSYSGSTTTVTGPLGDQAVYTFQTIKTIPKVIEIERQAGATYPAATATLTYDSNGYLNAVTDFEGNDTTWVNDSRGLPTERVEADGTAVERTTTIDWHATFRVPEEIVEPGRTTTFTYDGSGRMLTRTVEDTTSHTVPYTTAGRERTWTYEYDGTGLVTEIDGPRTDASDVTTYDYDAAGNLIEITNALSHVTEITDYDDRGLPLSVTDANGVVTELEWDDRGRLVTITVIDPAGPEAITAIEYDLAGQVTSVELPDGVAYAFEYDEAHRLTAIENEAGERVEYTVDAMGGWTTLEVLNAGSAVTYTHGRAYDELGRVLEDIGAASQTWAYDHDDNGNVTGITDPESEAWSRAFDALDRLTSITDPDTEVATIAYDARDNVVAVTDQRGLETTYVVDGFDEVIQVTSPDTGVTVLTCDEAGNVVEVEDARGVVSAMTYDALDRIESRTYPTSAEDVTYTYDDTSGGNHGVGRLTGIADETGTTSLVYDLRGNVVEETHVIAGESYVTAYAYDLADNLIEIIYPSGRIVTYGRDGLGRIEEVTTQEDAMATPVTVASAIAYEPFGPVAGLTWGNGLEAVYAHDDDYRLSGLDVADGATVIQDLAYGYNGRDDIETITDNETPARTQTFAYDALARLIEADGAYGLIEYAYDEVGNRTLRRVTTGGAVEKTYAYDSLSNRLETETRPGATRAFTYDDAGNVIEDDQGGAEPTYTLVYNDAGRLVQVDEDATPTTEYALNAMGERVVKQPYGTPASATHYHYALDGTLLAESEADGDATVEYIVLPGIGASGLPLALVPDPQGDPEELAFIHADHLGAAQAITDAGQAIDWDLVAGPFGELEDLTASLTHNPRFPGQYADAETGYRYNHFRDYDPAIGRYLQSDPIGLGGGLNTYAYVDGNPVNWVDPWGLKGGYVPDPTLPPEPEDTPDGDGPEMCIPRLFEGPEVPIFPEIQIVERRGPGGGRLPAALIPGYGERGTPAKSLGASVSDAKSAYPNLAGIMEWHHVWPKYLGGPNRGPVVRINAAYHQVITNAFRKAWPYGNRIPTTQELRRLIRQIYSNFPIPN